MYKIVLVTVFFFASANSQSVSFYDAWESAIGDREIKVLEDYLKWNHPDAETANNGWNLLIIAARFGNTEAIYLLLAAGSDVNAKDRFGITALILAARHGATEGVRALLLAPSIDVNIQDNRGDNALGLAENDEIKKMLELRTFVCLCVSDWCRKNTRNC